MKFIIYKDAAAQFRWTLLASNGEPIANSGEGYHNENDCIHSINLVASSKGAQIKYR